MNSRKGNAGTILVIMIMGFLMTVTTAYMKMLQTETKVQGMIDNSDRALDAAFSGIQYVMSVSQTKKEMFINTAAATKTRFYFQKSGTPLRTSLNSYAIDSATMFNSDWYFYDGNLTNMDAYNFANKPYMFRVCSVASYSGALVLDEYIIKSQGRFIEYSDGNIDVLKEYNAQIIAVVKIDFTRKTLKLKGWRQMQYQEADNDFFQITPF